MKVVTRSAAVFCAAALGLTVAVIQVATAATPERAAANRQMPARSTQEKYSEEELGEVTVEGYKPVKDQRVLLVWLARLIGRFEVSGTLQNRQPGNDSTPIAKGMAECIGFQGSTAPAVHCELDVQWPTDGDEQSTVRGASTFLPAVVLYGYSVDRGPVIRHLMVDSNGSAEGASGVLISADTLVSRAKCLNVPESCERIVRITAGPDQRQVKLEIAIATTDGQSMLQTLTLSMNRVP